MQTRLQLHYITQHCTTLITLQYTAAATTATLHYATLHYNYNYSTFHQYTTLHYTIHYTKYTTPQLQLQLQLHYTNYTTLQLQLTTTTPLHYNYTYNCTTTPHYIQQLWVRWPLQPLQPLQKHNSNHLSVHQWICSAIRDSQQPTSPIGFLFLKLPPPPCAVLQVKINERNNTY